MAERAADTGARRNLRRWHPHRILQLHHEQDPSMFAKLRPGHKPQLTFDSHWGLENQGAFQEAASTWTSPMASGGGETVRATWSARHVKDRFTTKSTLVVGYDSSRNTYTYDIDSELEVLAGEPFQFRYGFDFEHHTIAESVTIPRASRGHFPMLTMTAFRKVTITARGNRRRRTWPKRGG